MRKFSVLKEEMKVDGHFRLYILQLWNESGIAAAADRATSEEERKVEFVIVIDTSMSCKGEHYRSFWRKPQCASESEAFSVDSYTFFSVTRKSSLMVIESAMQFEGIYVPFHSERREAAQIFALLLPMWNNLK